MIIISGASRGIGLYLFNYFKSVNNEPVIGLFNNSIPQSNLQDYFKVDVRNFSEVEALFNSMAQNLQKIKLINCAGITYNSFAHKSDPDEWKTVIDVNLIGTFNLIRGLLPHMRDQNFGRIINFSSVVATKPTPGVSSYSASKAALWGMSKSIAIENASKNITINNINLGYSELGMIEKVPEQYIKQITEQIPAGHLCEGQDIISTVNYLLNTKYITGSSIDLSGGLI